MIDLGTCLIILRLTVTTDNVRIKGFFYILVFLLLALGSVLLFLSSQLNTIFFYIGEGLILFILIYLTFFYRKIVKPLNTIGSGMELLR